MNCPSCHHPLTPTSIKTADQLTIQIDECYFCGGHFLPKLTANFLPENTAKNLDSIKPRQPSTKSLSTSSLHCPICHQTMVQIKDTAVPKQVVIYTCPESHGHFFPQSQLIAFKKAQKAKLNYHQIWGIPLKSAFTILLPVIILFSAITLLPLTLNYLQKRQEARISASSPISQPLITPLAPSQILISFTTKSPTTSDLLLTAPQNRPQKLKVSSSPRTTHTITLKNLQPATNYSFTISTKQAASQSFSFTTPNH